MRYFRWQGALAFIAILALVFAFVYLLAGPIAKLAIEKGGAEYTGAEVNVGKVNVELSPFMLNIVEFQATDPKKPENNMVSFKDATVSVDLWQLIFGRTIIDMLAVNDLTFGDKRQKMGQVYRAPADADQASQNPWADEVEINLPDVNELLANADLKTVKRAQALEQSYADEKAKLEALKADLPSKEKLAEYQERVKALSKIKVKTLADIEKIKKEFDALKKEFKAEKAKLAQAKEQVLASKTRISDDISALKNASEEDWQDISSKYQLSTIETEDFAHMIFGEKAREYYQWAELILTHVKPLLASSGATDAAQEVPSTGGRFVHFDEENPLPSFWLKKGNVSITLADTSYSISLDDITHQHWLINKASAIVVNADDSGSANAKLGALAAKSQFELDSAQVLSAAGDWSLNQFPLNDIDLQESDAISLSLVHALLKVVGDFSVDAGELKLNSDFSLTDNEFNGEASSKLANAVLGALSSADSLNLNLSADGNWQNPDWHVKSELDKLLAGAVTSQLSGELAGFKNELQAGLTEKMGGSLALGEGGLTQALDIEALLTDSDKAFDNLMKSDVVKQQQKKLEDKAKDKLKDKLGDLFGG